MSLRLQRGNLSNSCMDIPKISRNTSGDKWRCKGRNGLRSVPVSARTDGRTAVRGALRFAGHRFEERGGATERGEHLRLVGGPDGSGQVGGPAGPTERERWRSVNDGHDNTEW